MGARDELICLYYSKLPLLDFGRDSVAIRQPKETSIRDIAYKDILSVSFALVGPFRGASVNLIVDVKDSEPVNADLGGITVSSKDILQEFKNRGIVSAEQLKYRNLLDSLILIIALAFFSLVPFLIFILYRQGKL